MPLKIYRGAFKKKEKNILVLPGQNKSDHKMCGYKMCVYYSLPHLTENTEGGQQPGIKEPAPDI